LSNHLAVATVTAGMGYLLRAVDDVVDGAGITYERPDRLEAGSLPIVSGVNLYLYRTRTDPSFRNQDLPARADNGQAVRRPTASLNLEYLITFFGDDSEFIPQRLLGWTTSRLHAHPLLTSEDIAGALSSFPKWLTGSDLAAQIQRVKLTPLELSLEDLSKIWSVFVAAPYLLSVAYEAGVVLVNPDEAPPSAGLPVLQRNIFLVSTGQPEITHVSPQWVAPGGTLTIRGSHFGQSVVMVNVSGIEISVRPESASRIMCTLPLTLTAGVNSLTVATQVDTGTPEEPRLRQLARSNVAAFVVLPAITSIGYQPGPPPVMQVGAEPLIGTPQNVVLWLTEVVQPGSVPRRYGLEATGRLSPSQSLTFSASGVASGSYMARLYVDQAESPPGLDKRVVVP
jgi:hypothetical protein